MSLGVTFYDSCLRRLIVVQKIGNIYWRYSSPPKPSTLFVFAEYVEIKTFGTDISRQRPKAMFGETDLQYCDHFLILCNRLPLDM
jgi:hypothetical protein